MNIKIIETDNTKIVICKSNEIVIKSGQTALDFTVSIGYEHDCRHIAVSKTMMTEDFFKLSTGIAGEIAQKLVNYGYHLAIIGDFSKYTSKPLRDYIYESNQGKHLYFVKDEEEAVKMLRVSV